MIYIGVDLGGTNIAVGLVDENGKILCKKDTPTLVERGYEPIVSDMGKLALELLDEKGIPMEEVASIGVGIPGIGNNDTGRVIFCTNLGWHDVPLRDVLQRFIPKPVYMDNDATVAALAENVAGVSAGSSNSVFLTLGTGLGGGSIIDGKVYAGTHHITQEFGHMIVEATNGEPCTCGQSGCWERYASATGMINMAKHALEETKDTALWTACGGNVNTIDAKMIVDASKAGDPVAQGVFKKYIRYLCIGLTNIINILDPEIIALGGGVSHAGQYLLDSVREELAKYVFYKTEPYARIELASLGNDAGIIGAAMLGK